MKILLFAALCCMVVLLLAWIRRTGKSDKDLKKPIIRLLWMGVFTVITQAVFFICGNYTVAAAALGLYYSSIDWLVIALLSYIEIYTQTFEGRTPVKIAVYSLAALDTLSFFLNLALRHVFTLEWSVCSWGYHVWTVDNDTQFFTLHLIFTYVIVLFCTTSLIVKAWQVPPFYRGKYMTVLVLLVAVVLLNGICMLVECTIDISVFMYCLMGIAISYYSLFYKPKGLIDSTLSLVVADVNDAVFCYDLWSKCVYANKKAEETFGESAQGELVKSMLESRIDENSRGGQESAQYEERLEIDGEQKYFNVSYHKLFDKKRRYLGCFFIIRDRTEEIRKFWEEHYRITHDRLTGLYNREYFFEAVEKKLAESPDEKYSMVCSNIKGFKLYNDLFGEEQGDEVLKAEAELLRASSGAGMLYGRLSGDEFAIFVPTEQYCAEKFIEDIKQMKERFSSSQYQMHIYIGVYEIDDNTEPVSVMCDKAKLAIESHSGDYNAIMTYYDRRLLEKSLYERKIVGEFDRALENGEFCMFLQPQIASDGSLLGAEALVRWQHPERGLVFPGDFIDLFEKTGLIYKLDRYMWEMAAAKLREWKDMGKENLYISVNISAKDFYYMDIYKEVTGLVEKYGIAPGSLKLEITETVLMTEMRGQTELLERLRSYGFQIEIDDFGSGYSSLNMLKNIDVDIVKIDMGFLDETERLERGTSILSSIILLIKKLGMGVITEGVETKEQVDSLLGMGCNMFQGYYFAKPMPVPAFEEKYKVEA